MGGNFTGTSSTRFQKEENRKSYFKDSLRMFIKGCNGTVFIKVLHYIENKVFFLV